MVACRLFSRAKQLYAPKALMPSLLIPKCDKHVYSRLAMKGDVKHLFKFMMPKDLRGTKGKLPKMFDEETWNFWRYRAEQDAREGGSPFCFTIPVDHVSSDDALSKEKDDLSIVLRILVRKFDTKLDLILKNHFVQKFSDSLSADEIRNTVMRHLYILTLREVIPSEKLYMEYLINDFNHWELVDQWWNEDYVTLLEPYSELFTMLPYYCLKRGLQGLKKEMLTKLEKDYNLLTSKINDLPSVSEAMMAREIEAVVSNRDTGFYKCFEDSDEGTRLM